MTFPLMAPHKALSGGDQGYESAPRSRAEPTGFWHPGAALGRPTTLDGGVADQVNLFKKKETTPPDPYGGHCMAPPSTSDTSFVFPREERIIDRTNPLYGPTDLRHWKGPTGNEFEPVPPGKVPAEQLCHRVNGLQTALRVANQHYEIEPPGLHEYLPAGSITQYDTPFARDRQPAYYPDSNMERLSFVLRSESTRTPFMVPPPNVNDAPYMHDFTSATGQDSAFPTPEYDGMTVPSLRTMPPDMHTMVTPHNRKTEVRFSVPVPAMKNAPFTRKPKPKKNAPLRTQSHGLI